MTADVSVVITTYRRSQQLAECLDGVRVQTRPADEVVVVVHRSDQASALEIEKAARTVAGLRYIYVEEPGAVAALNRGLAAARKSIVAFVDDDAVPAPDWLERIVQTFESDDSVAAVGGRDHIIENGKALGTDGGFSPADPVGRIQWFGRMLGNHHVGEGPPRDVDVLKGANMSFRRSAVAEHAFDARLRGRGAQVHSELSICLPLRRQGLRVVYDPAISVTHSPAPRPHGDRRHDPELDVVYASSHNEALEVLDYFGRPQRAAFAVWAIAIGTTNCPGLAVFIRDRVSGRPAAWDRFRAAQRGRASAWRTRRTPRRGRTGPLLHRPAPGWRNRHLFGALGMRPPIAQHSHTEAALLMRYAAGADTIVELGVAEGGSAAELRAAMSPRGQLFLVDPYEPGRFGLSLVRMVARRAVNDVRRGRVKWVRSPSDVAVVGWGRRIDFLFIDADHSYERAAGDWSLWTPFVAPGGHVALHDSVVFPGGWTDERSGPVRLLGEILAPPLAPAVAWTLVDQADSLSILRREPAPADREP